MIDILLMCLALTVYHEARGEPVEGQNAVAHVVMNRVADKRWSSNVCEVTRQRRQFSWVRRANPLPDDEKAWNTAVVIANAALEGRSMDSTKGATHYHSIWIMPRWARKMKPTKGIGNHVFYRTD